MPPGDKDEVHVEVFAALGLERELEAVRDDLGLVDS
jgi:hypothetical protein